jgi:hypothetical protein
VTGYFRTNGKALLDRRKQEVKPLKKLLLKCYNCGHKMAVPPLDSQVYRGKTCDKCGATFSFSNAELENVDEIPSQ